MELNRFIFGNAEFTFFQNEKSYKSNSPLLTPPHLHPFPELFIALTGEAAISGDFGVRKISSQNVCIMPPLVYHDVIAGQSYNRLSIPFIIREITPQDSRLDTYRIFSQMLSLKESYITSYNPAVLKDIYSCLVEDKLFRREKLKNIISLIFIDIAARLYEHPLLTEGRFEFTKKDKYYETLIELDQAVQLYFQSTKDYRSICNDMYLTPRQVSRIIFSEYHKNAVDLRSEARMRQAVFYLKKTKLPVAEISEMLGYSSRESFAVTFKKYFCVSPLKVRNFKA
ncbi:MAG: helix-turn-helix domain-containing protein [Acutalibacteraceae bacterium]